jgi:hypothetical protein
MFCQVATRRVKNVCKVEIPNVEDPVSKLQHMGKETVRKLRDIRGSAAAAGIDVDVPENCIDKGATLDCIDLSVCQLLPGRYLGKQMRMRSTGRTDGRMRRRSIGRTDS